MKSALQNKRLRLRERSWTMTFDLAYGFGEGHTDELPKTLFGHSDVHLKREIPKFSFGNLPFEFSPLIKICTQFSREIE